jgi:hypothetical protein
VSIARCSRPWARQDRDRRERERRKANMLEAIVRG